MDRASEMTTMLECARTGDSGAAAALLPLVYDELRNLAGKYMQGRGGMTLQPTAVVHEAYVKLIGGATPAWEGRAHFFAVAAKAMRQILADRARARQTAKRGGQSDRVTLSGLETPSSEAAFDLTTLHHALEKLSSLDPQQASVVECRFLGGMTVEETAQVLGISARTVEREWAAARAWLRRELA